MKVRYLGTAPGQARRCGINVVIGRTASGAKVWGGERTYERGQEYLVSDELGAALLKRGGFEVVEEPPAVAAEAEPEPRKRGRKEE